MVPILWEGKVRNILHMAEGGTEKGQALLTLGSPLGEGGETGSGDY